METTYRNLSDLFEQLADQTKAAQDAERRAYYAAKNAKTGATFRTYARQAADLRADCVTTIAQIKRLLGLTGFTKEVF